MPVFDSICRNWWRTVFETITGIDGWWLIRCGPSAGPHRDHRNRASGPTHSHKSVRCRRLSPVVDEAWPALFLRRHGDNRNTVSSDARRRDRFRHGQAPMRTNIRNSRRAHEAPLSGRASGCSVSELRRREPGCSENCALSHRGLTGECDRTVIHPLITVVVVPEPAESSPSLDRLGGRSTEFGRTENGRSLKPLFRYGYRRADSAIPERPVQAGSRRGQQLVTEPF